MSDEELSVRLLRAEQQIRSATGSRRRQRDPCWQGISPVASVTHGETR
jgi:hypothetical protein